MGGTTPAPSQRRRRTPRAPLVCALAVAVLWAAGLALHAAVQARLRAARPAGAVRAARPAEADATESVAASARPKPVDPSEPPPCSALSGCAACASRAPMADGVGVCVWCGGAARCEPYAKRSGKFPCNDAVRVGAAGYPGGESCSPAAPAHAPPAERVLIFEGAPAQLPGAADTATDAATDAAGFEREGRGADGALRAGGLAERVPPVWLDRPGRRLEDALLVGNGRLGASTVGGVLGFEVLLNEESLWSHAPRDEAAFGSSAAWDEAGPAAARAVDASPAATVLAATRALLGGNDTLAERLAARLVSGSSEGSFEYLARLAFDARAHDGVADANTSAAAREPAVRVHGYRRELLLASGLVRETFTLGGCAHSRELFASAADGLVVARLRARPVGRETGVCCINVHARLARPEARPPPVVAAVLDGAREGCAHAPEGCSARLELSSAPPPRRAERASAAGGAAGGAADGGADGGARAPPAYGAVAHVVPRPGGPCAPALSRARGGGLDARAGAEVVVLLDGRTSAHGGPAAALAAARATVDAALAAIGPPRGGAGAAAGERSSEEAKEGGVWAALLARHAAARAPAAERASIVLLGPRRADAPSAGGTSAAYSAADSPTATRIGRLRLREAARGGLRGEVATAATAAVTAAAGFDRASRDDGATDEAMLLTQAFALGRHLLLSAGGGGSSLPANLQGVWSDGLRPPWKADFHLNVNLQMAHWLPTVGALLPEVHPTLLRWLSDHLARSGARVAAGLYGCEADGADGDGGGGGGGGRAPAPLRAWVAHGFTDAWARATPLGETVWSLCAACGGWLALALWEAHRFGEGDATELRAAYPALAGAARGLLCRLSCGGDERGERAIRAREAQLQLRLRRGAATPARNASAPDAPAELPPCGLGLSTSPENSYAHVAEGGRARHLTVASSFDRAVADALFDAVARAEAELGGGELGPLLARARRVLRERGDALPPSVARIGADGRLSEWAWPLGAAEVDPAHRHWSHLWALFPGGTLGPLTAGRGSSAAANASAAALGVEAALSAAARRSIDARLAAGGAHTGWSAAWLALLRARLHDGDGVARAVRHVLAQFASPSLLGLHPPMRPTARARAARCAGCVERKGGAGEGVFQLDASVGVAAAIAEALLQSHTAACAVHLLPALPTAATETAWRRGEARGLRARGGLSVGMEWENGALVRATLHRRPRRALPAAAERAARAPGGGARGGEGEADDTVVRVCVAAGGRLRAERGGREWPVAYDAPASVLRVPVGDTVALWL
ncbi:hypothetical protein KFE25_001392 [Diacronema lutheri]|uniref:Glycosyl hydrolase family 95 N-terminal domain-containing protein n=1 Tax=Diacronema lutheri TaxID=2081491 RepID=A0A8J5XCI0_DIALT|nr:hypothetical protein KFE25_001392 [Diacronema lutheri]